MVGTRFYDATAFSMGNNASPTQDVQSFLYPLDMPRPWTSCFRRRTGGGHQRNERQPWEFSVDAHAMARAVCSTATTARTSTSAPSSR